MILSFFFLEHLASFDVHFFNLFINLPCTNRPRESRQRRISDQSQSSYSSTVRHLLLRGVYQEQGAARVMLGNSLHMILFVHLWNTLTFYLTTFFLSCQSIYCRYIGIGVCNSGVALDRLPGRKKFICPKDFLLTIQSIIS